MTDLRNLVRAAVGATEERDPAAIAEQVLADLTDDVLRSALRETLPNYVRLLVTAESRNELKRLDKHGPPEQRPDVTVHANGEWKSLVVCDEEDIEDIASRRDRLARGNAEWAARFRALGRDFGVTDTPQAPFYARARPADISVLRRRIDHLKDCIDRGTSPELQELARRRDVLQALAESSLRDIETKGKVTVHLARQAAEIGLDLYA